jgi:hypothetical protein
MLTDLQREILTEARCWIADPKRWCQGALVRAENGVETGTGMPDVASACGAGAVIHAARLRGIEYPAYVDHWNLLDRKAYALRRQTIVQINDQLGREAVLEVYDALLAEDDHA